MQFASLSARIPFMLFSGTVTMIQFLISIFFFGFIALDNINFFHALITDTALNLKFPYVLVSLLDAFQKHFSTVIYQCDVSMRASHILTFRYENNSWFLLSLKFLTTYRYEREFLQLNHFLLKAVKRSLKPVLLLLLLLLIL